MAPILLIGALPAANEKARTDIIAGLDKIAAYAKIHDPETTKHATHVSLDSSEPLTVYAIEEYTSQAACDAHMQWPPVLEFVEAWKADPDRLSGPPEIWHAEHVDSFTRAALADASDPFVVLGKLQYASDAGLSESLPGWAKSVPVVKENEPGTLSYAIGKDKEVPNRITFVDVYESKEYFEEVHMKVKFLQEKLAQDKPLWAKPPQVVMLKRVAGYLHK